MPRYEYTGEVEVIFSTVKTQEGETLKATPGGHYNLDAIPGGPAGPDSRFKPLDTTAATPVASPVAEPVPDTPAPAETPTEPTPVESEAAPQTSDAPAGESTPAEVVPSTPEPPVTDPPAAA